MSYPEAWAYLTANGVKYGPSRFRLEMWKLTHDDEDESE
jgi:hypothetical protein